MFSAGRVSAPEKLEIIMIGTWSACMAWLGLEIWKFEDKKIPIGLSLVGGFLLNLCSTCSTFSCVK